MKSQVDEQRIASLEKILNTCFLPELPEDCIDVEKHYQNYIDNITSQLSNFLELFSWVENQAHDSLNVTSCQKDICRPFYVRYKMEMDLS